MNPRRDRLGDEASLGVPTTRAGLVFRWDFQTEAGPEDRFALIRQKDDGTAQTLVTPAVPSAIAVGPNVDRNGTLAIRWQRRAGTHDLLTVTIDGQPVVDTTESAVLTDAFPVGSPVWAGAFGASREGADSVFVVQSGTLRFGDTCPAP